MSRREWLLYLTVDQRKQWEDFFQKFDNSPEGRIHNERVACGELIPLDYGESPREKDTYRKFAA